MNSNILVLPSIEDGYGMVVPEAMSYGTIPFVSLNAGSSDLVENGINGFLFNCNNADELAKKIINYYSMEIENKMKIFDSCIHNISQKSWDDYALDFLRLINYL
ncbi:hypothetical protein B0W81_01940 [Prochlorococcus sp. HOT_208_60]|nr:hypothetical protein B0W81_01940 [Prochlorococcus sp. HOT_208_60]